MGVNNESKTEIKGIAPNAPRDSKINHEVEKGSEKIWDKISDNIKLCPPEQNELDTESQRTLLNSSISEKQNSNESDKVFCDKTADGLERTNPKEENQSQNLEIQTDNRETTETGTVYCLLKVKDTSKNITKYTKNLPTQLAKQEATKRLCAIISEQNSEEENENLFKKLKAYSKEEFERIWGRFFFQNQYPSYETLPEEDTSILHSISRPEQISTKPLLKYMNTDSFITESDIKEIFEKSIDRLFEKFKFYQEEKFNHISERMCILEENQKQITKFISADISTNIGEILTFNDTIINPIKDSASGVQILKGQLKEVLDLLSEDLVVIEKRPAPIYEGDEAVNDAQDIIKGLVEHLGKGTRAYLEAKPTLENLNQKQIDAIELKSRAEAEAKKNGFVEGQKEALVALANKYIDWDSLFEQDGDIKPFVSYLKSNGLTKDDFLVKGTKIELNDTDNNSYGPTKLEGYENSSKYFVEQSYFHINNVTVQIAKVKKIVD